MRQGASALASEATIDLVGRAQKGDADAIEELLERTLPLLRRWAHGRLPASARGMLDTQDLVQDTVVKALENFHTFQPRHPGALLAYLRTTLLNRIRDQIRRVSRRPSPHELRDDLPDTSESPLELAIGRQQLDLYDGALQRLKPEHREAIVGRFEIELSYEELAVALDKKSANAARLATRRALARLTDEMSAPTDPRHRARSPETGSDAARTQRRTSARAATPTTGVETGDASNDFESVVAQVTEGSAVDWRKLEETTDPDARARFRQLRVVSDLADAQRSTSLDKLDEAIPDRPLAAGDRWSHLVIVKPVGEGSSGTVYLARDPWLEREVALKVFKGSARLESEPSRFEASRLACVRDPNVVAVHGTDIDRGQFGMWMELVEGQTLQSVVASRGPLSVSEAAWIGQQLCRALVTVHDAGIIHSDVKAQNIVQQRGGRIVLMDFGASRFIPSAGAQAVVAGTPVYLAPELLTGGSPTVASDLYAAGVVLYHLVTGIYPVDAQSLDDLRRQHERGRVKRLREVRPDMPETFAQVVDIALSTDPRKRYSNARAMEEALSKVEAIPSEPGSPLVVSTGDESAFAASAVRALGSRRWLLDQVVTRVIRVRARVEVNTFEADFFETDWSFSLAPFISTPNVDPLALVFMALYPSGSVRGISVEVTNSPRGVVATLVNPLCLLDPVLPDTGQKEVLCEIEVVGLPYLGDARQR